MKRYRVRADFEVFSDEDNIMDLLSLIRRAGTLTFVGSRRDGIGIEIVSKTGKPVYAGVPLRVANSGAIRHLAICDYAKGKPLSRTEKDQAVRARRKERGR